MAEAFKTIETQEQLDIIIKDRLARQEKSVRAEYADYDGIKVQLEEKTKEANGLAEQLKSLTEKSNGFDAQLKAITEERDKARAELDKTEVALSKGLPTELISRITGSTKEEMEADAEKLAKLFKAQNAPPSFNPDQPSGDPKDTAYKELLKNLNIN